MVLFACRGRKFDVIISQNLYGLVFACFNFMYVTCNLAELSKVYAWRVGISGILRVIILHAPEFQCKLSRAKGWQMSWLSHF